MCWQTAQYQYNNMAILSFEEFLKQTGGTAKDIRLIQPEVASPQETGFMQRVTGRIQQAGGEVERAISGTGEFTGRSTLGRAFGATGAAFGAVPQVAMEASPSPVRKVIEKVGEAVGGVINLLGDKISDIDALQNWVSENPDAARKLEDIAGIGKSAGTIAGTILMAEGGAKALTKGKEGVVAGVKFTGKQLNKLTPEASSIMQRVARVSKGKQASFEKMAGESIGQYLDKRGIYGNIEQISDKLYQRFTRSKGAADSTFARIQGEYNPLPVKNALEELLKRESKVSVPGARSMDYATIKNLYSKFNKDGLNMTDINIVKRLYERNVKLDYVKQNLPESVARANNIDSAMRNWQIATAEKLGVKGIQLINKETRLAKQLVDDIGKEYAGSAGNNAVTLTDWIALSGGDPASIAMFLAKKGFSTKEFQSWVAKKISKTEKLPVPKAQFGIPQKGFTELGK
mgnify:CR=1 FL=1